MSEPAADSTVKILEELFATATLSVTIALLTWYSGVAATIGVFAVMIPSMFVVLVKLRKLIAENRKTLRPGREELRMIKGGRADEEEPQVDGRPENEDEQVGAEARHVEGER